MGTVPPEHPNHQAKPRVGKVRIHPPLCFLYLYICVATYIIYIYTNYIYIYMCVNRRIFKLPMFKIHAVHIPPPFHLDPFELRFGFPAGQAPEECEGLRAPEAQRPGGVDRKKTKRSCGDKVRGVEKRIAWLNLGKTKIVWMVAKSRLVAKSTNSMVSTMVSLWRCETDFVRLHGD